MQEDDSLLREASSNLTMTVNSYKQPVWSEEFRETSDSSDKWQHSFTVSEQSLNEGRLSGGGHRFGVIERAHSSSLIEFVPIHEIRKTSIEMGSRAVGC